MPGSLMPSICLAYAWHMPGICPAYAGHIRGICRVCRAYEGDRPGIGWEYASPAHARHMLGICLAYSRAYARHMPGRHMTDICPVYACNGRHMPGALQPNETGHVDDEIGHVYDAYAGSLYPWGALGAYLVLVEVMAVFKRSMAL